MHTKTSLHAHCMHSHHPACNLLRPAYQPANNDLFNVSNITKEQKWYCLCSVMFLSPLNLRQHSANNVVVPSRLFLMTAKFCHCDNFVITLVKTTVTPTNVFTLFWALSCRHSCSLVTWFTLAMLQASQNGFKWLIEIISSYFHNTCIA